MAALPYIQLYVADYLADTIHLTTEEHGAYMLLIFNYWQTGKPLPSNRLASISKLPNERWTDVEQTLREFFTLDDDGHWYHERIEMDLNKVKSKSIQASKAGKLSAAKRAASKAIDSKEDSNGRSNAVERESNHTEAEAYTEAKADTKTEALKPNPVPAKKKKQQEIVVIEYPDELNKEAWLMWIDHRREAKIKKLTPRGENIAIKQLIAMGDHAEQLLIIEQSMGNSYTGLFPLKKQSQSQQQDKGNIMEFVHGKRPEKLIN